jgi:AraC-like DNA-binding protein
MSVSSQRGDSARRPADYADVLALESGLATSIDLMRTSYHRQVFPRHAHDYLSFGMTLQGAGAIWHRGANRTTHAGDVVVIGPGEVHTGGVERSHGFLSYMTVHVPIATIRACAESEGWRGEGLPAFGSLIVQDADIAAELRRLDAIGQRARGGGAALAAAEQESANDALVTGLALLVRRHVREKRAVGAGAAPRGETRIVRLAREMIDDCYADNSRTSLRVLAEYVGVTPFHLVREFTQCVGLSPHRYVVQTRIDRASALLRRGVPPSFVAAMTGFADQSHLTQQFKRYVGTTPASYQRCFAR